MSLVLLLNTKFSFYYIESMTTMLLIYYDNQTGIVSENIELGCGCFLMAQTIMGGGGGNSHKNIPILHKI